jgi:hypothetical protein
MGDLHAGYGFVPGLNQLYESGLAMLESLNLEGRLLVNDHYLAKLHWARTFLPQLWRRLRTVP